MGLCFTTANGGEVPNEGQKTLPTFSENFVRTNQRWQVADTAKPLLSVGEECDLDQWVVFTAQGGFIYHPQTQAVRYIKRDASTNYVYEISMWVPPAPQVAAQAQGFPGQGR